MAPGIDVAGPENGCPNKFAICFDPVNAARLARYLSELRSWAQEHFICEGSGK